MKNGKRIGCSQVMSQQFLFYFRYFLFRLVEEAEGIKSVRSVKKWSHQFYMYARKGGGRGGEKILRDGKLRWQEIN